MVLIFQLLQVLVRQVDKSGALQPLVRCPFLMSIGDFLESVLLMKYVGGQFYSILCPAILRFSK